jgi:hypothetical protein
MEGSGVSTTFSCTSCNRAKLLPPFTFEEPFRILRKNAIDEIPLGYVFFN